MHGVGGNDWAILGSSPRDQHRTVDGDWVLDFNHVCNPSGAYSDRYVWPLVPREVGLSVRIEAGERANGPPAAVPSPTTA